MVRYSITILGGLLNKDFQPGSGGVYGGVALHLRLIESGRRNFMYGPAGPDLAKNLRHIFHLEMRAKSFLDIK